MRSSKLLILKVTFIAWIWLMLILFFSFNPRQRDSKNDEKTQEYGRSDGRSKYLVDTKGCKIPDFSPFDKSIIDQIDMNVEAPICAHESRMVSLTHSDGSIVVTSKHQDLLCYYLGMDQDGPTNTVKIDKQVKMADEFGAVSCRSNSGMFTFNRYLWNMTNADVPKSILNAKVEKNKYYNVLIIGIDATSRLNKIRNLKKTSAYIERHLGALELNGYMKVADNTYPNLVAMLTGGHENDQEECVSSRTDSFDNCPFIWKTFSKHDYVTTIAEDQPHIGAFTLDRPGFIQKPVDHYMRPLMQQANNDQNGGCIDGRTENKFVLDYLSDFVLHYKNRPFFGLAWLSAFSHESINTLRTVDTEFEEFFKKNLVESGLKDNTIVFFLSDHGSRVEKIRGTLVGRYEDSLPFLTAMFPKSFHQQYPGLVKNFERNAYRLSTPFDIHETLLDILNLNSSPKPIAKPTTGISLFKQIPTDRTCDAAKIPPLYCVCEGSSISRDFYKDIAAKYLVEYLNTRLSSYSSDCEPLELLEVVSGENTAKKSKTGVTSLRVVINVMPSGAQLEAVVNLHYDIRDINNVIKCEVDDHQVNRLNKYGLQSWCMHDVELKKFCYCKQQRKWAN